MWSPLGPQLVFGRLPLLGAAEVHKRFEATWLATELEETIAMLAGYPDLDRVGRRQPQPWPGEQQPQLQHGPPPTGCWRTTVGPASIRDSRNLETGIELVGTEVKSITTARPTCAMASA